MLETGSEIRVRSPSGGDAGTFMVRGLKAKGGQGYVYSLRSPDGGPAVLKVPSPSGLVGNEIEIRILLSLPTHRNVVRILGTANLQGVDCAVLGYAHQNPYRRLNYKALKESTQPYRGVAPKTPLPATTAVEMIHDLLSALEHIHRYGFVHGDIKPANILVELRSRKTKVSNEAYFRAIQQRAYRTILADFGSTRSHAFLKEEDEAGKQLVPAEFTPVYAPPEVFLTDSKHSGTKVDVYQVGVLLYQFVSGYLPYDHLQAGVAAEGLTPKLISLKQLEGKGDVRSFDPHLLRTARQQDVVFAEAFASQRMRDRFFEDVTTIVDLATTPVPAKRPSIAQLRGEMLRLFELEPPRRGRSDRPQVSVWNPRWHLARTNRLAAAAKVAEEVRKRQEQQIEEAITVSSTVQTQRMVPKGPATVIGGVPTQDLSLEEMGISPRFKARPRLADRPAWEPPSRRSRTPRGPEPKLPPAREVPGQGDFGPRPDTQPEEPDTPVGGLKVAVVDDDRVALAVLSRSLRKRGCLVRTFQDPESALESISRDQPDAAIIDMQMPGISGMELIKRLRRRLKGLPFPVLILSSVEEEAVLKEAYRHGVRDYLIKPVTEAELIVKLEKAIQEQAQEEPPAIPRELAGFELLEEIRRGEVAIVFNAVDVWDRYPDLVKAVKVLRPELAGDAEPLLRMRREIDVLARCEHAGLARLCEAGLEGRLLFYVADEIPARSLGQEVREEGTLNPGDVVSLLQDVGEVLSYLHAEGIVIGDLTPESLGRNDQGRIMVTDLGCSRWPGSVLRLDETPLPLSRYEPPELFEDPPQLDARADLYSLGICALEAYCGKPAARARSNAAVNVPALTQGMPEALASLLDWMVSPLPDDRLPTANHLLNELRTV